MADQGSAHMRLTTLWAVLAAALVLGPGLIACDEDDDGDIQGHLKEAVESATSIATHRN